MLGAAHKIVIVDRKKLADSERVVFDFRTKKISAYGIDDEILKEIHKFPFPLQQMLVKQAFAMMNRLVKDKGVPELFSLDCHCLFRNRYMLPCKHIFHEHIYGNTKLLTANAWRTFQEIFEESGFEVYEHRELIIVEEPERTEEEKKAENRRLAMCELTERLRDKYWRVEESNAGQAEAFITNLEASLNQFLNQFNKVY